MCGVAEVDSSGSAPDTQDYQEGFPVGLQVLEARRKHIGELVERQVFLLLLLSEAVFKTCAGPVRK